MSACPPCISGVVAVSVFYVLFLGVAILLLNRLGKWRYAAFAASWLPVAFVVLHYAHFSDGWLFYYRIRTLSHIEWTTAVVGVAAGIVFCEARRRGMPVAGTVAAVAIGVVALLPYWKCIITPLDLGALEDRWDGPYCHQTSGATCGPACLATLLNLAGQRVSEKEIAQACLTSNSGTEIWYLARYAKSKGFDVRFEHVNPDAMKDKKGIAGLTLIPNGTGHFVAVLRCDGNTIEFVDPMSGRHTKPLREFLQSSGYTGFMLVLK